MGNKLEETAEMYRKAQRNLVDYRYIMLAVSEDEVDPAPFHYDWSHKLLNSKRHTGIQGFRESAKGQLALRAFPEYCITYPSVSRDYIVLIKNNATLASNKLKEIETELMTNPLISSNIVRTREKSGDVLSVDCKDLDGNVINVRIEAYGKRASIRGLSYGDRRPKIIIMDDVQDLEDSKSDTVQEKDWEWFLSDVKFLGEKSRIFMIGNNLGERCLIERVFKNKEMLDFDIFTVAAITKEGKSAWAAKYKIEDILAEKEKYRRIGKLEIWQREKMCIAVSEETRIFKGEDRRYFVTATAKKLRQGCNCYFTIDGASSQESDACYRAIVVNCIDENNKWFIVHVAYGRWDSAEFIRILFDLVKEWKPEAVGIEKGWFKQILEPFIYDHMSKKQVYFDIVGIEHGKQGSKLERVKMLGPRFKAHDIWFPQEGDWLAEMEAELNGVTKTGFKSLFVDLIDALSMQEQIAEAPYGNTVGQNLPRQSVPDNTMETLMGAGQGQRMPQSAPMNTSI